MLQAAVSRLERHSCELCEPLFQRLIIRVLQLNLALLLRNIVFELVDPGAESFDNLVLVHIFLPVLLGQELDLALERVVLTFETIHLFLEFGLVFVNTCGL